MTNAIATSSVYSLASIFTFEEVKNDFPFNIKIITKPEAKKDFRFFGPGIYSIFDRIDNLMIYIGIYTPADSVIDKRYRKHLQTLTLRGTEVTFKSSVPKNAFLAKVNNESLVQDLNRCSSFNERLVKDRCVSHINKVNYAASNWNQFATWNPEKEQSSVMDKRFVFQFEKIICKNVDKKFLQNIEVKLIAHFNPLTNSSYNSNHKQQYKSQIQISDIISALIEN